MVDQPDLWHLVECLVTLLLDLWLVDRLDQWLVDRLDLWDLVQWEHLLEL